MERGREIILCIAATGHGRFGVGRALFIYTGILLLGKQLELFQLE
jgi:hypothetical protein